MFKPSRELLEKLISDGASVIYLDSGTGYTEINVRHIQSIGDESFVEYHPGMWSNDIYYSQRRYMSNKRPTVLPIQVVTFGSDPEFFLVKDKKTVPAGMVYPKQTVSSPDGFQIEIQPENNQCRELAANRIYDALGQVQSYARKHKMKLDFSIARRIEDDVWKKTSNEVKQFGCSPTVNSYTKTNRLSSGLREKFRACGGHIHIGNSLVRSLSQSQMNGLVKIMDIVAGNTFVLIDRDKDNAVRRKKYGRAGEYRVKPYGLEYRVLSNFWLRHYVLWSFASGLVRQALEIYRSDYRTEFLGLFNQTAVRKAINENDYDLALQNFKILAKFIKDKNVLSSRALSLTNIDKVEKWLTSKNPTKTLNIKTTTGVLKSWRDKYYGRAVGFERFISSLKD